MICLIREHSDETNWLIVVIPLFLSACLRITSSQELSGNHLNWYILPCALCDVLSSKIGRILALSPMSTTSFGLI